MIFQQLPGHKGNIVGGGFVIFGILAVVKAGAVDEIGIVHTQLLGFSVHHLHKSRLAAGDMLGHSAGAIVGRRNGNGFDHIGNGHTLPHL